MNCGIVDLANLIVISDDGGLKRDGITSIHGTSKTNISEIAFLVPYNVYYIPQVVCGRVGFLHQYN